MDDAKGTPPDAADRVAEAVSPTDDAPAGRARRRWRAVFGAALGLALGLAATEAVFRQRDGGAFPLVNVYEPDDVRGVRLRPGAVTRVGRRDARITEVRVNREGFRGADWPRPSPDDVLVVGDSQSFGLGVAEDETLAARLHASLGTARSEEHTSELQSLRHLVCRLLLEKKK